RTSGTSLRPGPPRRIPGARVDAGRTSAAPVFHHARHAARPRAASTRTRPERGGPAMTRRLPARWTPVPRAFYRRHPTLVASELLNPPAVGAEGRAGGIVEAEAYAGSEDPAAHSDRGMAARKATLFGEAGHLCVYFSYGLQWGSNAVGGEVGEGAGVLLRAIEPVAGI